MTIFMPAQTLLFTAKYIMAAKTAAAYTLGTMLMF